MSWIKNLLIMLLISVVTLKVVDIGFGLFLSSQVQNASLTKGTDRSIVLREINPNQFASIRPNNNYMKDVENLEQRYYEINIDENGFIDNGNTKVSDPEPPFISSTPPCPSRTSSEEVPAMTSL